MDTWFRFSLNSARLKSKRAVEKGGTYDPDRRVDMCAKSRWGLIQDGAQVLSVFDKTIQNIYAEQFERPDFEE